MTLKDHQQQPTEGTHRVPIYYEVEPGADFNVDGDVCLHQRLFTYRTDLGLVTGWTMNVMFSIERPARVVWPYFKDFNLWQKDHYYSGVVGDLEGKTFNLADSPNDLASPYWYQVLRVIPEHVIVFSMPVPETSLPGMPGLGGVRAGFDVFMLNEHGGKTVVTGFMEHGSYASRSQDASAEQALAPWRAKDNAPEWQRKWRDDFIPALKKLIYQEG